MKNLVFITWFTSCLFSLMSSKAQHPFKTERLANINPNGSSFPKHFNEVNGNIIFLATNIANGSELWCYNSVKDSTYILKDIAPGSESGVYRTAFQKLGNHLLFKASDRIHGLELWITDGTTMGTHLLKDIHPGSAESHIQFIEEWNGILYFEAVNTGHELWRTDGTTAGTYKIKQLTNSPNNYPHNTAFMEVANGTVFENKLFFTCNDSIHGRELWVTNGTDTGTYLFKDINGGRAGSYVSGLTSFKNHLYFKADDGTGSEIWISDGTPNGTRQFANINPRMDAPSPSFPNSFHILYNKLFFSAFNYISDNIERVYYTSGAHDTVHYVMNSENLNWKKNNVIQYNGKTIVSYSTFTYGEEPYYSTDNFNTFQLLVDVDTSKLSDFDTETLGSSPTNYFIFNQKLFFLGRSQFYGGVQLWVYNDLSKEALPMFPFSKHNQINANSSFDYIVHGDFMYFCAKYDSTGYELWRAYDSTLVGLNEATLKPNSPYKIYPNPNANNTLHIASSQPWQKGSIRILSLDGKQLHYQSIPEIAGTVITIQKELPKGMYLIEIVDGKSHSTLRYIKK